MGASQVVAAVFTARAGGKCGLFLHEFAEGAEDQTAKYAKYAKEELSQQERSFSRLKGASSAIRSVFRVVRVVRGECGFFNWPCGRTVSLAEPKERIHLQSEVEAMDEQSPTDAI